MTEAQEGGPETWVYRDNKQNGELRVDKATREGRIRVNVNGHIVTVRYGTDAVASDQDLANLGLRMIAGLSAGAAIIYDPETLYPVSQFK